MIGRAGVCALTLLAGAAAAHDYPTVERVLYVEACVREHPERNRQEMVYKCACAIDAFAAQMSYDQFVEASTAANAGQTAGERGTAVRESATGQELADAYRKTQKEAFRKCFIQ